MPFSQTQGYPHIVFLRMRMNSAMYLLVLFLMTLAKVRIVMISRGFRGLLGTSSSSFVCLTMKPGGPIRSEKPSNTFGPI